MVPRDARARPHPKGRDHEQRSRHGARRSRARLAQAVVSEQRAEAGGAAPGSDGGRSRTATSRARDGLVRLRAAHPAPGGDTTLVTFDDVTYRDCLSEKLSAGDDCTVIGSQCAGLGSPLARSAATPSRTRSLRASRSR
jgi:hypothetical protein